MSRRAPLAGVLLAFILTSCGPSAPVAVSATPTPEPTTPAPTATPTPTPSPTAPPTSPPVERPATTVAGDRLMPFYFEIRRTFTALPPTAYILPDEANTEDANAVFYGLASDGVPQFAVRTNFVIDKGTAAHEVGHAYQKVLEKIGPPSRDVMALYWTFRGFPGTWQAALKQSQLETNPATKWALNPYESWAEAFRAGVMLEAKEKTEDYKRPLDPAACRQFFLSLAPK